MNNITKLESLLRTATSNIKLPSIYPLTSIMYTYNGTDWRQYAEYIPNKYNRILLPVDIPNYNLYLMCWSPTSIAPIHGHPPTGCIFKILDGELLELRNNCKYIYSTNQTSFIQDDHEMSSPNTFSASLHLYSKYLEME